ncbi:MAG: peroxiredoxin-like family protein [Pseudomonadota bacterium]|nr:peroxiredoxin-like family protein [Pseudomonadota bacterium]
MSDSQLVEELEKAFREAVALDAPLNERMKVIADRVRALSDVFADAVDRMVDRLQAQAAGAAAPKPGEMLPSFLLPDETGRLRALVEFLGEGPVAVSFVRGHWCPYCRLNAVGLAEIEDEASSLDAKIVVIAPERRRFNAALKSEAGAGFPILSDMDNGYALSLNLAIWVGAEMERLIDSAGWHVPHYQGNGAWIMPVPATFVLDREGVIVTRSLDPDYRRRMEIDDLLAAIRRAR